MKINYKDPRWQKKRLEVLKNGDFRCEWCKSTTKELNVHHIYYQKNKELWDYKNCQFMVLCDEDHKKLHQYIKFFTTTLSILTPINIKKLVQVAIVFVDNQED